MDSLEQRVLKGIKAPRAVPGLKALPGRVALPDLKERKALKEMPGFLAPRDSLVVPARKVRRVRPVRDTRLPPPLL